MIDLKSSYSSYDVTLLLKDITNRVTPLPAKERERLIQSGVHYCEMLPLEYVPSKQYIKAYQSALCLYAKPVAIAACQTAERIYKKKGQDIVLVSLARAGIPIGILLKHYLDQKYSLSLPHYAISIIRGMGIDHNAMRYILQRHKPQQLQFVDGWVGKGAITRELKEALLDYKDVSSELAVLSDPAYSTTLCGTHEDILIPSSCLNSTVSGLISRTFYRSDIIGESDFHGAAYYEELKEQDLSYSFIQSIEQHFDYSAAIQEEKKSVYSGLEEVKEISKQFSISNINLIKPGIGEATRVLLRRIPWKLLVKESEKDSPLLTHLYQLAEEKKVPILFYPLKNYKACGIIQQLSDL